jgi:hypothetical protein
MPSSAMLRRVAPVRTDVMEDIMLYVLSSVFRLQFTANVIPIAPILVTLIMETIRSFETSFLTGAKRRNIPEDGILHALIRI